MILISAYFYKELEMLLKCILNRLKETLLTWFFAFAQRRRNTLANLANVPLPNPKVDLGVVTLKMLNLSLPSLSA